MNQNLHRQQPKRAFAYLRYSSEKQSNGETLVTQRHVIERYAKDKNIIVDRWFIDEAKSGKNADRSGLQNLLEEAMKQRNSIDHVIVYKMNRASRDLPTFFTGVHAILQSRGITLRSATEHFDDSAQGNFLQSLYIGLGQLDNELKRDFTKDNMRQLARQGYWQNAPIVGYSMGRTTNDEGKLRPILVKNNMAPLVQDVLERFSEGNISKAELTRYAAAKGLRSRYGNKLSEDRIHKLIKNPAYAGYVASNHTDWELIQGKHDSIISKETYDLNQTLLFGKRVRAGEKRQAIHPDYPLKGLVLCPKCTKPLYASAPKTGAGGKSPRYHCSRSTCKGMKSVKADIMHDSFIDMLKQIKPDERVLKLYKEVLLAESTNRLGKLNTKISRLRNDLSEIDNSRILVIKKFTADQISFEDKNELIDAYDKDKLILTENMNELLSQQRIQETDIEFALNVMERVDAQWLDAPIEEQQRFQRMLFPEGLVYDHENHRFGTTAISPLYRYVPNKKDLPDSEKSFLVAGAGFEPATCWL